MQGNQPTRSPAAWLVAFVLAALGAKLWTIEIYGTALPYWDQWDEARLLFKPWLEGSLTWRDFFIPHNEHRIFFTRLLDLLEVKLNGQWDPLLQMVVNAGIHTGYGAALAWLLWHFIGRQHAGLICFLLLPFFALPFAAENTVHGFQSQMYFLNIFSVAAIVGLGFGKTGGGIWFCGLAAAGLALFTMASGLLAAAAVIGLIALRWLKERRLARGQIVTALAGLAVVALGFAVKVSVEQHQKYQAKSVWEFGSSLLGNLAWPFSGQPAMAVLLALPLAVGLVSYFQSSLKNPRAAEFVLTFGLWGILQAAAVAYSRANLSDSSRYFDTLSTFPMASAAALFLLMDNREFRRFPTKLVAALAVLWAGIVLAGLGQNSRLVLTNYLQWSRMWGVLEVENVRAFVATGNPGWLKSKMPQAVPYWNPDWLIDLLRQPKILSIMPPDARPALKLEPEVSANASFVLDGCPPGAPKQKFTEAWGDYATNRPAAARHFLSKPITARLPKLLVQLGGSADTNGLTVQLVAASGRVTGLRPAVSGHWQTLIVDAPPGPFRLEIKNPNPNSWVAVGELKELGRFSFYAQRLLDHAALILAIGLGLWIVLAGAALSRAGLKPAGEGIIWLLILLVVCLALAGVWSWRGFNAAEYTVALHKKWAVEFSSVGHPGRAELHLHEALWLQPDDAEAGKALGLIKARGIEELLPEKIP